MVGERTTNTAQALLIEYR